MPAPFTFAEAREILTPQGNGVTPGFAEPPGDAQQRPDDGLSCDRDDCLCIEEGFSRSGCLWSFPATGGEA